MDIVITEQNASESKERRHHFYTEASDLGLRAGQWPTTIKTTLGNGRPFIYQGSEYDASGEELEGVMYRQSNGILTLMIFND